MELPPVPQSSRWPPRGQFADGVVAGLLSAAAVVELATSGHLDATVLSVVTVIVAAGAYAWRRRTPTATVVVVYAAMAVADLAGTPIEELATSTVFLLIPVYSAALYGRSWRPFAGLAAALAGVTVSVMARDSGPDDLPYAGLLIAGGWLAGWLVRLRIQQVAVLTREAARNEHERQRAAVEATLHERTRIARELHDVLAHSVSAMVVQAAAADRFLPEHIPRAQESLGAVQDEGRRALADLGHLLGVLREDHHEIGLVPQPTATDVAALVARTAQAGLPVSLSVEGEPASLPPGLGLSVFRIVQEALTNVRRHAGTVPTAVHLCYGPRQVTVEVTNERGRPSSGGDDAPLPRGGRGLVGMRERARLCGGVVEAGGRPDGGYTVRAKLPLESPS